MKRIDVCHFPEGKNWHVWYDNQLILKKNLTGPPSLRALLNYSTVRHKGTLYPCRVEYERVDLSPVRTTIERIVLVL